MIISCIKKISKRKEICYSKWLSRVSQKSENSTGIGDDSISFSQTVNCDIVDKWFDVMKIEVKSMEQNI